MGTIFFQPTSNRAGCSAVLPVDLEVFIRTESLTMAEGGSAESAEGAFLTRQNHSSSYSWSFKIIWRFLQEDMSNVWAAFLLDQLLCFCLGFLLSLSAAGTLLLFLLCWAFASTMPVKQLLPLFSTFHQVANISVVQCLAEFAQNERCWCIVSHKKY